MLRSALLAGAAGWLLCVELGCTHVIEARAIEGFTAALDQQDLKALKAATSKAFENKALRLDDAVDDLNILNLPTGEVSIVNVEDVSENKKRVTVTAGKQGRKEGTGRRMLYTLTREDGTHRWVVDDVYVKQKHNGVTAAKSVTEQMDLLLSLREFLTAWSAGGRDEALSVTTDELHDVLSDLPPAYFARLTRRVAGKTAPRTAFHPQAEMDQDVAVVRLPRDTGQMVLSFRMQNGTWKVSDAAVESPDKGRHIPSVLKTAAVIRTATEFLAAYGRADRSELARVCTNGLFRNALAHADLTSVNLPAGDVPSDKHEIHLEGQRAEFILPSEAEVVKISLVQGSGSRVQGPGKPSVAGPSTFRVQDVTIYELHSQQEKRLSAVFTAQAVMRIFNEALAAGDLDMLRQTATPDFNKRVWSELTAESLHQMPLGPIAQQAQRVVSTNFSGAVTEITVLHNDRPVTYVLRDVDGEMYVDDVLMSANERPDSLKTTWELLIPAHKFATGIRSQQIEMLQRTSSDDFNRLVWRQLKQVPAIAFAVPRYLNAPLTSVEQREDTAVVVLGDDRGGAQVLLVKEHDHWVVDEVLLIAGPEPADRARLKQTVRTQLANGEVRF